MISKDQFFLNWGEAWEKHASKALLKSLFKCSKEQIDFLENYKPIMVKSSSKECGDDYVDFEELIEITFRNGKETIVIAKQFEPRDYEFSWLTNKVFESSNTQAGEDEVISVLDSFPFEKLIDEWYEIKKAN